MVKPTAFRQLYIMKRKLIIGCVLLAIVLAAWAMIPSGKPVPVANAVPDVSVGYPWYPWEGPDTATIAHNEQGDMIRYGRDLISRTAYYLGPQGKVAQQSNGMNCQNCHLEAGTKPWGNNYSGVSSMYPLYRDRSGSLETIQKRVNDCLERSLNGKTLDTNSREMKSIVAYMHWLGKEVKKGKKPLGAGITPLKFLDRAADPARGKEVYIDKCQRCHGANGEGLPDALAGGMGYAYPPLWGEHSYNIGAGLYRLSRFAGYVKDNMPFGASHLETQLTDEEAWDVAAFVNSQPRPTKDISMDWPDKSTKPFDHPFGPYTDSFTEQQHKYGPFDAIVKARKPKGK